jgi:ribosomal protein S18
VYKEYRDEHAVPISDSRYALLERFLGARGMIASTATTKTCRQGQKHIKRNIY